MHMHSLHSVTRSGGIGVIALIAGDGTMAGDGIVLIIAGDTLRVTGAAGMAATGVASMAAVATGDIITTGVVLAGAGAVVETIGLAILIIITVVLISAIAEEVPVALLTQLAEIEELEQL